MSHLNRILQLSFVLLLAACSKTSEPVAVTKIAAPVAPIAEQREYQVESPNGNRRDEYYWLRDDTRKDPAMLAYLNQENAYTKTMLAHTDALKDSLYKEIVARIKQDDSSVPVRQNGYWYYTSFSEGKEYPVYARRKDSMQGAEEILIDGNARAAGKDFYQMANFEISPDNKIMVFAEDTVGRRQYEVRFRNIETGTDYPDVLADIDAGFAWANDNKTLLYIEKDPTTLLGYKVKKHVLGTDVASDELVYEETDRSFYMGVGKGRSGRFIYINLGSTVSSEILYADASDPKLTFKVLLPRERDHEYDVDDLGDRFIIRTNYQAKNFRIVEVPIAKAADRKAWKDVIGHRDDALVEGFTAFKTHLAINERSGGLRKIRIKNWKDGTESLMAFDEPAFTASINANPEQDSNLLRFSYTSMTTPNSIYDYDLNSGERELKKRDPVIGDFDPANYVTEFRFASARDGTQVPVSLLYRKGTALDGTAPVYQYGYGSYGNSMNPAFSSVRLSLVDRGVIYALAHIRGGQEMGRHWYEDGKLHKKMNTFTDFIDVTDYLVTEQIGAADKIIIAGGSAGGLLVGAVANLAPQKYKAIIAHVAFVDVVTTMLDESIPLTTNEFDEWGNPKIKEYYDTMLAYSPYDNISAQNYPAMFVTTGLWDSQVQYFEPAKWVARLRVKKTDNNPLLFKINMEAGHGGKSGRFQRYEENAQEYAFVLDQFGLNQPASTAQ